MTHGHLTVTVALFFSTSLMATSPTLPRLETIVNAKAMTLSAQVQISTATNIPVEPPTEETLGVPIFPNAVYLTSYDAGQDQTYHLFGTNSPFEEMVRYYTVVLEERGESVFTAPPVHIFETERFREDSMAFQPSVTIKDYSWNDSEGYLDPKPNGDQRYRSVIQIVPAPTNPTSR